MDGLGFIASLHATTLDSQNSTNLVLRPIRKQNRSTSNGSISGRAKSFVTRSRGFFSSSSSSSVTTRTSMSSSLQSSSDHAPAASYRRSQSTLEDRSIFTASSTSTPSSEGHRRYPNQVLSRPSAVRRMGDPDFRAAAYFTTSKHQSGCSTEDYLDPMWMSTLVDDGYDSPLRSAPSSPLRCEMDADNNPDIEPSRASSMLDRDLFSVEHDDSPRLPRPVLAPQLSFSIAEQLAFSLEDDEHQPWLADCQNLLQTDLVPGFKHIRRRHHQPRRPHTAKT